MVGRKDRQSTRHQRHPKGLGGERVRAKLVEHGLDATLARKKRETPPIAPIFDGAKQAHVIALACSQPPPP